MRPYVHIAAILAAAALVAACSKETSKEAAPAEGAMKPTLTRYAEVELKPDLGALSEAERKMIPLLVEAARHMDEIFWLEAYGDRRSLLSGIADPALRRHAEINYGPWDRLRGNEPFIAGVGTKPKGARFYPTDMTVEEFEKACAESPERAAALRHPYAVVQRDAGGRLVAVPYRFAFADHVNAAAEKLRAAAALAEDVELAAFLEARAAALLSDEYRASDIAWLDMKTNGIDIVIGPIENYEDGLFGHKTAHEAFVLVKDKAWSARLARYAAFLPELQRGLPVPDAYKQEMPGTDSDLNAYDAVFYAGDCNAGSKTIAINLPNDESVQLEKGTRRLQIKNAMRAKFDTILSPIADRLIAPDQRKHVTFDAFFSNVMFHEVAHGLGIKNTLSGSGTVRTALKEVAGPLEEGKADVLGLYMITKLHEKGELPDTELMDHYVTYLAGIFRSIRFGASSAHGRANLAQFERFRQMGAFVRDEATGTYRVDVPKWQEAMTALAGQILKLQGDGDYAGTVAYLPKSGEMEPVLKGDLDALATANIPTDIVFKQ